MRILAERELEALDRRRAAGEYVAPAYYVLAHTRRGKLDKALALLEQVREERDWFPLQFRVNPLLDPLRNDPRFARTVASLMLK